MALFEYFTYSLTYLFNYRIVGTVEVQQVWSLERSAKLQSVYQLIYVTTSTACEYPVLLAMRDKA